MASVRPRVTFILLTFNQEALVEQAVRGALLQEYDDIQLIISDDCSSDSTFGVIESTVARGSGPKDLIVRQNSQNLGLARHVNEVSRLASGDIILLAAGDDVSLPGRTRLSVEAFNASPAASCVDFQGIPVDTNGDLLPTGQRRPRKTRLYTLQMLVQRQRLPTSGASRAYRRTVFDLFGPLRDSCPTEDSTLLFRSLLIGSSVRSHHPGILYRIHGGNLSRKESLLQMDVSEIRAQYRQDLLTARTEPEVFGPIDFKDAQKWIEREFLIRDFTTKITQRPSQTAVRRLLATDDLRWSDKAVVLRRAFRNLSRG